MFVLLLLAWLRGLEFTSLLFCQIYITGCLPLQPWPPCMPARKLNVRCQIKSPPLQSKGLSTTTSCYLHGLSLPVIERENAPTTLIHSSSSLSAFDLPVTLTPFFACRVYSKSCSASTERTHLHVPSLYRLPLFLLCFIWFAAAAS